jgi:hypothetical protein
VSPRDQLRAGIDAAREELTQGDEQRALEAFARGEHATHEEALESVELPAKATDNDVTLHAAMLRAHVASIRTFVEKHGAKWAPHVRERWLVRAEEVEDRVSRLEPGDALRKAG